MINKIKNLIKCIIFLIYFIKYENFVFTHPKTGRTWVQKILSDFVKIKYNNKYNKKKIYIGKYRPFKGFNYSLNKSIILYHPNIFELKVYRYLNKFLSKKIIFILREPICTTTSYYYHQKFQNKFRYLGNLNEYLINYKNKIIRTYNEQYIFYLSNFYHHKIKFYEDIKKNTYKEISSILFFFLKKKISKKILDSCIKNNNFKLNQKRDKKEKSTNDIRGLKFRIGKNILDKKIRLSTIKNFNKRIDESLIKNLKNKYYNYHFNK